MDMQVSDEASEKPVGEAEKPLPANYSVNAIHLLRTAQINTLTLSQMADQKASILMGATFLVFSLTVSRALVGGLSWSLIILAATAFLSSLCAVMAVLPSVSKPKHGHGPPNKLFFGHFAEYEEEEWMKDLLNQLEDDEALFRTMLRDVYQNGQVLHRRKYRFLGLAYKIFIAGLFLTMAIYLMEVFQG